MSPRILLSFILLFLTILTNAQVTAPYNYQHLSANFYKAQKDSLKKAWACPDIYKSKKTQAMYKEIWDSRTEFLISAIENQNFIFEPEVKQYVQTVVDEIYQANKAILKTRPVLLIDRSSSANAYALGNNIVCVNLGLLGFCNTREELTLTVAHELSHNILDHADRAMREKAEWLTSDEYNESLKAVLDSKYERFSKLKKVLETYKFDHNRHQRFHEADADSLAAVLLKNAKMPFKADFFLRMDSADLIFKTPLKQPLKTYFEQQSLKVEDAWIVRKSKGLSTKSYNFNNGSSSLDDSLKTHPDCQQRFDKMRPYSDSNVASLAIPASVHQKVSKMIVWNVYDNMRIAASLYLILREIDNGNKDEWYKFMLYNIFAGLCYNDNQLHRFVAIGITPKEYIAADYYALQNMLEQMPKDALKQWCKTLYDAGFWSGRSADEKAMREFMNGLALNVDIKEKETATSAGDFIKNYNSSMYCEFADHFSKK